MLEVYTLKSCDTCRKAVKWLESNNITANILDIRSDGISSDVIATAVNSLGWEKVLNRRSTTWRGVDENLKQDMTAEKATALIVENPTLMKRPLFVSDGNHVVGFDKAAQSRLAEITL